MSIEDVKKEPWPYEVDPISKLRAWQHLIRALPHLVSAEPRKETMRALMAWYERVVENNDETGDPPIEGLDALTDELTLVSVPHNVLVQVARARWAVRVAEELVQWRRCLSTEGPGSAPIAQATGRLEGTIEEGKSHIEGGV